MLWQRRRGTFLNDLKELEEILELLEKQEEMLNLLETQEAEIGNLQEQLTQSLELNRQQGLQIQKLQRQIDTLKNFDL